MSNAEEELDALMARLADGDRSAFSPVFERLWAPIQRFCASMLKNDADAADAAQQTMTKIFEHASDYDRTRRAMPWALAIAAWECRTLRRKQSRRREAPEDAAGEPVDASTEETLLRRDLDQAVRTALSELSALDRDALIATFWEQAGSASGATLRKRRERALDRMRDTFRRLYGLD